MSSSNRSAISGRRRHLLGAALIAPQLHAATLAGSNTAAPADPARTYLVELSEHLEMRVTRSVQLKVSTAVSAQEQRQILQSVHERLQQVIGPALETARETIGACVADDLLAERYIEIHGLNFAHTELALLLAARSDD